MSVRPIRTAVTMLESPPGARFGIAVDDDNGAHVRFRLFAATGGQHLGGCGQLVMRADEFVAFYALLAPALSDRPDPPEVVPSHPLQDNGCACYACMDTAPQYPGGEQHG